MDYPFVLPDETARHTYSQVTEDVLSYIHENSPEHLTLSEISMSRNWNVDHMIRCFKRDLDMTPHKYITLVKADMAIRYMRQGKRLQDISELLGYSSVSSLSASFKNATNRRLSEFRNPALGIEFEAAGSVLSKDHAAS